MADELASGEGYRIATDLLRTYHRSALLDWIRIMDGLDEAELEDTLHALSHVASLILKHCEKATGVAGDAIIDLLISSIRPSGKWMIGVPIDTTLKVLAQSD